MPLTAVISTLPSTAARTHSLVVGGIDMNVTGDSGTGYAIDISTVQVEEQGPGGISSMSFEVFDPAASLDIDEDSHPFVEFWDLANDRPLFAGFVQSSTASTQAPGRTISVECIGIEVLLDWQVLPANFTLTTNAGAGYFPDQSAAIQAVAASVVGVGIPLNVAVDSVNGTGSQAKPIGTLTADINPLIGESFHLIDAGTSMREAIRVISEWPFAFSYDHNIAFTIDFRRGLRAWPLYDPLNPSPYPSDYPDLTIVETFPGIHVSALNHEVDASSVYSAVAVIGGNAAATGVVAGSGKPGPVGVLEDATLTSASERDAAGRAWLASRVEGVRGSYVIEAWSPDAEYHPGGPTTIVNGEVGLSGETFVIASIKKAFVKIRGGVRETWTVSYGNLPPSAMRDIRRLAA